MSNDGKPRTDQPDNLGHLTHRASRALAGDLGRRFAEAGLPMTVEQWRVLALLTRAEGLTQNELADRLGQEKTGVSRLLRGLESRGLVRRESCAEDRRNRRVYVAGEGRRLAKQGAALADETLDLALRGISENRLDAVRRALTRMVENVRSGQEDGGGGP